MPGPYRLPHSQDNPCVQWGENRCLSMEQSGKGSILRRVLANDHLPSLSPLLIELMDAAADESCSVTSLAETIQKDPGLSTRLLKLVNSAFYAPRQKASSVSQAIMAIGLKRLRVLILTVSLRDAFPLGRIGGMDYDYFWKTSLYRAIIAEEIVRSSATLKDIDPQEAFLAGLILEVGMLMIFQICPEVLKDSFPGGNLSLNEVILWEKKHLGIHHREIGYMTLSRWRFPETLIECQRFFGPDALVAERSGMCKLMELTRATAHILFGKLNSLEKIQEAAPILGLDPSGFDEILCRVFMRVQEMADQLRLNMNSDRDVFEVMEKANLALARINGSLEKNLVKILGLMSDQERSENDKGVLEDKRRVVEDFMEAVAHEIRNPLMVIGGFARRISRSLSDKNDLLSYTNIITREVTRLEAVLTEMSALSHTCKLSVGEWDLTDVLNDVLDEKQPLFDQKGVKILRDYEPIPFFLLMDRDAVSKAVGYILEMLAEYTDDQGKIWLVFQPLRTAEIRITIGSVGAKIPEDVCQMLSDLDFSSKAFGRGLSLIMSRKILEAHDGRVHIEKEDDITRFVIHLPVTEDQKEHRRQQQRTD
ncbi:MAG: HDOD domain-containing protein [Pseudomonadota bacterium]